MLRLKIVGISYNRSSVFISSRRFKGVSGRRWLEGALTSGENMQNQGMCISKDYVLRLAQECTKIDDLNVCKRIQSRMCQSGIASFISLDHHLLRLLSTCESLPEANQTFNQIEQPSHFTWNAIISGHSKMGRSEISLQFYDRMHQQGMNPDKYTLSIALKTCSSISSVEHARCIHEQIIDNGFHDDIVLGNSLVDMYNKCNSLAEAQKVFFGLPSKNMVTWGAMASGYAQHDEVLLSLKCFEDMKKEDIAFDKHMFSIFLKACSCLDDLVQGRQIHGEIIHNGFQSDVVVGSALVDMYAKCGSLEEAQKIFDELPNRNIMTWGALIAGYTQNDDGRMGLSCFEKMQHEGIKPNRVIFSIILIACSKIGAIDQGRHIHQQVIAAGLESDIVVGSSLLDMYAKCGNFEEAHRILNGLANRDVVSWGAIIAGYAQCGKVELAEENLMDMQKEGIKPNAVIFASLLSACSHAGLVDNGCKYFRSMREDHGIVPDARHYNCMVDLLSRAGHLSEAKEFLIYPDIIGWKSLLSACKTYGNVELGRQCFDQVAFLDPHTAAGYVLMSGIYSDAYMWKDATQLEQLRHFVGAWKKPAKAWIEVNKKVHEFVVGGKGHSQNEEISAMLRSLCSRMKDLGYTPKLDLVLQDISDQEKENALCGHCEKQAIVFGLISTSPGTTIQITKNLRMCMDCHSASKVISKIERREIIIRDAYRVHHFRNGSCLCGDYN